MAVGATGGRCTATCASSRAAGAGAQRRRDPAGHATPQLRGEYVAVGAHNDHIGYRAAGAVDHDSLHLYNAAALVRDGESERRAR